MKLEEKLKELGFTQNPQILEQRSNRKLEVRVYVKNDKIYAVQMSKGWNVEYQNFSDYGAYLTKVRKLFNELNKIL